MAKLTARDHAALDELVDELNVVRIDAPSAIATVLPELRRLTELDALVCASPVERTQGWALDRIDCDNFPNDSRFKQLAVAFLDTAPRRFGWFDACRPESAQRNVVLHLEDLVSRAELESSAAFRQVLVPLRLHHTKQIRTLICEGPTLLAWFGAFHAERATPRQVDLLISMIPALRKRLSIERQLTAATLTAAALETAMEQIAVPAFVVTSTGRVLHTNQLGRATIDARHRELSASIAAAVARRPARVPVDLVRIRERGADCWLALLRSKSHGDRVVQAVARAAAQFQLTARQRVVLELVLRGESNTSIAGTLAISERAVEQHMSAMFERTRVSSRAALISLVLLER